MVAFMFLGHVGFSLGQRGAESMNTGVVCVKLKALFSSLGTPLFRCPLSSTMNWVRPLRGCSVPKRVPVEVLMACGRGGERGKCTEVGAHTVGVRWLCVRLRRGGENYPKPRHGPERLSSECHNHNDRESPQNPSDARNDPSRCSRMPSLLEGGKMMVFLLP